MKKILALILVGAAVCLSGCGDKEAREYASKLIVVLDTYEEQLNQKIAAEQASYVELADTYEEARVADIDLRLSAERVNRSETLASKIASGEDGPTLSQILEPLKAYAKSDFETTQVLLQEEMDSRSKYLTDLESLKVEAQKIKVLREALGELAKSKSDFKNFKGAADFLLKTDEGMNKLLCADLKKQLDQLKADKDSAVGDDKKKIEQKIKQTTERMSARKCS